MKNKISNKELRNRKLTLESKIFKNNLRLREGIRSKDSSRALSKISRTNDAHCSEIKSLNKELHSGKSKIKRKVRLYI